ncbi:MAG: 4Fe-4S dicluster domain-containing protein [Myxococcales bacterium]|nr:4Fe-4S dicluster domain-containing protein [Myxococcales bacterium]
MAKRYAMAMDTRLCVGCTACVLACKTENNVPDGYTRDWVEEVVSGTFPTLQLELRSNRCQHCDNAPCVSACPTGASYIGPGGVVLVNADKCTGCKACIASCPYNARFVHPKGHVDKCTFCTHRTAKGKQPACVTVCPTSALVFGDRNDPDSSISQLLRSRRYKRANVEAGTKPNMFFLI